MGLRGALDLVNRSWGHPMESQWGHGQWGQASVIRYY
jgi:hypothetical protein